MKTKKQIKYEKYDSERTKLKLSLKFYISTLRGYTKC